MLDLFKTRHGDGGARVAFARAKCMLAHSGTRERSNSFYELCLEYLRTCTLEKNEAGVSCVYGMTQRYDYEVYELLKNAKSTFSFSFFLSFTFFFYPAALTQKCRGSPFYITHAY